MIGLEHRLQEHPDNDIPGTDVRPTLKKSVDSAKRAIVSVDEKCLHTTNKQSPSSVDGTGLFI